MRLTARDGMGTLLVATAAILYGLWTSGAALPGTSVRVLAGIVFGLGWVGCMTAGPRMAEAFGVGSAARPPAAYTVIAAVLGVGALVVGIMAIVGGSETLLVALLAATIALWAMATARHALARPRSATAGAVGEPRSRAA